MPSLTATTHRASASAHAALFAGLLGREGTCVSLGRRVEELARKRPHRSAVLFEDRHYSYRTFNAAANRVSSVLASLGLQQGDRLALLMDNRPELLFSLVAANKLGVISAPLSLRLDPEALVRAIASVEPRALLLGARELPRLEPMLDTLPLDRTRILVWNDGETSPLPARLRNMNRLMRTAADVEPRTTRKQLARDVGLFVHANEFPHHRARMRNQRVLRTGAMLGRGPLRLGKSDVCFLTLPFSEGTGAVTAWAATLSTSGTVALGRAFDPDIFWRECHRYRASWFAYSPEVCEALLAAAPRGRERSHQVRLAAGRGLGSDLWATFQDRFALTRLVEHYDASAGDLSVWGMGARPGALGQPLMGQRVARINDVTGDVLRDHRGRVVRCRPGEQGILIARIDRAHHFDGYLDPHLTRASFLENAFGDGSDYFSSGQRVDVLPGGFIALPSQATSSWPEMR